MLSNLKKNGIVYGIILLFLVSLLSLLKFTGSLLSFLLFDISFLAAFYLIFPKPRLHFYTFMSMFLFLGFWMKFHAHFILGYNFLEPVGAFKNTANEWSHGLTVSAVAAIGLVIFRIGHLAVTNRKNRINLTNESIENKNVTPTPDWYLKYKPFIWIITIILIIGINIWNIFGAFYQVGINTKLVLFFPLNLVLSWLINIGFGLWISTLIFWEYQADNKKLFVLLLVALFEAFVSSVTSLSRSVFIFRTLPYVFLVAKKELRSKLNLKRKMILAASLVTLFVMSLGVVTLLRVPLYLNLTVDAVQDQKIAVEVPVKPADDVKSPIVPGQGSQTVPTPTQATNANAPESKPQPQSNAVPSQIVPENLPESKVSLINLPEGALTGAVMQVLNLTVGRWIGLEGVLAVSANNIGLGMPLIQQGILEDPNNGVNSIFQKLSNSGYLQSTKFTFLTLPGITAILYYSGSYFVVLLGIILVLSILFITEHLAKIFIKNKFLLSFIGLAMANVICQMNFPYLSFVFFVELWFALLFIWFIQEKLNGISLGKGDQVHLLNKQESL